SFCLVPPVRAIAFRLGAVDVPGPRKIHTEPRARLGGLAVVTAAFVVFAGISFVRPSRIPMISPELIAGIAGGLIPIFLVSFLDDLRSVRALTKLFVHFLGAAIAVSLGTALPATIALFGHTIQLGCFVIHSSCIFI